MFRAAILGGLTILAAGAADGQTRDRLSRIDPIDRIDRAERAERAGRAEPINRGSDRISERRKLQAAETAQAPQRTAPDQAPSDPLLADTRLMRTRDGFAARRGEILALNLSDGARTTALNAGMTMISEDAIGAAGLRLARLNAPPPLDSGAMLDLLRTVDPQGVFDFNHAFAVSGPSPAPQLAHTAPSQTAGGSKVTLGMIDGGALSSHPDLANATLRQRAFPEGSSLAPTDHGTAVAGRLAETLGVPFTLLVADVLTETGAAWTGADALAAGLAWLSLENVDVVNVSLAGPPNEIVERIVAIHIAKGGAIIAAVGNGGPFSTLIYPAAYPGVTGVTAVDGQGQVYPLATTGVHVDRSALGVDVSVAVLTGRTISSGTSWAAPVVAAAMARGTIAPSPTLAAAH
ncbi:MAG: S8 family serine peptidase [Alphaproteobacteria bacterium]|nr:S8 family serine peptidase [Alphaproteobacteria bacterium]